MTTPFPHQPQLGGLINGNQFPNILKYGGSNPLNPGDLLHCEERPVQFPVGHNISRPHRSDAGQRFQQFDGRLIQIDQSSRGLPPVTEWVLRS